MENPRTTAFVQTAKTIIKQLERRNMEGYFCETSADAVELIAKAGAVSAYVDPTAEATDAPTK